MMRMIQVDESRILHLPAGIDDGLLILQCTEPHAEALLKPHLLQEEVKTAAAYQKAQSECRSGAHPFHGNLFTACYNLKLKGWTGREEGKKTNHW